MKRSTFLLSGILALSTAMSSCYFDGVGPYEEVNQTYGLTNFDRLDMGSAMKITVRPGTNFDIQVRGIRRDIEDLEVYTRNGTLFMKYRNHLRTRRYETNVTVTMPTLRAVDFSGASKSTISGFRDLRELNVSLSGASKATVDVQANRTNVDLSGSSDLDLVGTGAELHAQLSGASDLESLQYPVSTAEIDASGASSARVAVSQTLVVSASGASKVRYRGNPQVRSQLSGSSSVRQE